MMGTMEFHLILERTQMHQILEQDVSAMIHQVRTYH